MEVTKVVNEIKLKMHLLSTLVSLEKKCYKKRLIIKQLEELGKIINELISKTEKCVEHLEEMGEENEDADEFHMRY